MKHLQTGQFHGQTNETIHLNGITLTDTEYTQDKVDWHYHENAYFTFLLQGAVMEGGWKEVYHCTAGSLLFHHWQDPHYNIKPPGFTRGFHIELAPVWFASSGLDTNRLQGSIQITNPDIKFLLYQIFRETKISDDVSPLSIEGLIVQTLTAIIGDELASGNQKPSWVDKVKTILHIEADAKIPWII